MRPSKPKIPARAAPSCAWPNGKQADGTSRPPTPGTATAHPQRAPRARCGCAVAVPGVGGRLVPSACFPLGHAQLGAARAGIFGLLGLIGNDRLARDALDA